MLDGLLYQFKETLRSHGKDIKINNADARVILKSTKNEHDDKEILTTGNINRGDYINYNNLNFLALTETADKYGSVYSKSTVRKCNFDLKFIINDKLYLFYSIVQGDKFFIQNYSIISVSADAIQVTLPLTEVTKQLQKLDAFIKWGQKWEIQGIDYSKDGLVILHCKVTGTGVTDDKINEIAGRYTVDKVDKLNGNIIPILPFNEVVEVPLPNIVSVETFGNIPVDFGTLIDDIVLPSTLTVTLDDATTIELDVMWDKSSYDGDVSTIYTFNGTIGLVEGITNTNDVVASVKIVVGEAPPEDVEPTYTVTVKTPFTDDDPNELWYGETYTYTVNKFIDGVETSGNFTFEISDTSKATISNATSNSCDVTAKNVFGNSTIKLIVTDVDTNKIAIEKAINIKGK